MFGEKEAVKVENFIKALSIFPPFQLQPELLWGNYQTITAENWKWQESMFFLLWFFLGSAIKFTVLSSVSFNGPFLCCVLCFKTFTRQCKWNLQDNLKTQSEELKRLVLTCGPCGGPQRHGWYAWFITSNTWRTCNHWKCYAQTKTRGRFRARVNEVS